MNQSAATSITDKSQAEPLAGEKLEHRLEELLHQERFVAPASFSARGPVDGGSAPGQTEQAAESFWAAEARRLHGA